MKIKTLFFLLSLVITTQVAFADTDAAVATPGHKFVRGLEGLVSAPFEYFNQYSIASEKHSVFSSLMIGVFGGTAMTIKRLVNGVYDVISFPINAPEPYALLLKDEADTALQNFNQIQNTTR